MSNTPIVEAPEMLTMKETAERAKVSLFFVRNLVLSGKVSHVRSGRKYLVNWARFCDFLNRGGNGNEG